MSAKDASTWIGIVMAFIVAGTTWGVLSERTNNTILTVAKHGEQIEAIRGDSRLRDQIAQLEKQIDRLSYEVSGIRDEMRELRKRGR